MGTLKDEPTTKVTLFLYTKDIETLKRYVGYGYTAKVREIVRQWIRTKVTTATNDARKE
jgi:hypothetical protein